MKKVALILVVLLIGLMGWGLIHSGDVSVTINGRELAGPVETAIGSWGLLIGSIVLSCVAILLAFVFAGVGILVIGFLLLTGLIFTFIMFPALWPLLLPLFIVWVFVALMHHEKKTP
jgi:hypothetical protein